MSLQYVIDGYNLINHRLFAGSCHKSKDSRFALLEFISEKKLCGSRKNKIIVVFDGYPDERKLAQRNYRDIEVLFSREESADEKIKKIVESAANPKNIVVVSDDRQIRDCVSYLGAKLLRIEEFIGISQKKEASRRKTQEASELTYSQMHQINEELKRIWLK